MPLRQLFPDPSSAVGPSGKVDVIAIHGLNPKNKSDPEHARDTWRTPAGPHGRLWLQADLPEHIPDARIFLYQYNATAVYGKDKDTFVGKASELLEAIRIERDGLESRPILFLGHSMGGLLIKQALINAHNNPKYTQIKDATTGIAFFATPHHGGDEMLVSLGGVATKIALALGFKQGDDVIKALKSGTTFSDVMQEHWRHQLLHYDLISFWGAFDNIVPPESSRLGMPGDHENVVKLNADHSKVCKFGSGNDDQDNFKLVRTNIKDLYQKALKFNHARSLKEPDDFILNYPLTSVGTVKTFVQRDDLRDAIRDQLCRQTQDNAAKVGVWGMGGVGKTQVALSYSQHYRRDYTATFWIQASQPALIDQEFIKIYRQISKITESQSIEPEDAVSLVHRWILSRTGTWLFVFDGADELENDQNPNFVDISRYIPGLPRTHVIITSRNAAAQDFSTFEGVHIKELEKAQAAELFQKCAKLKQVDKRIEDGINEITKRLGYLALAITLAGSYVSQRPTMASDLSRFILDYDAQRQSLLKHKPRKLIEQYEDSVMTTWEMSYAAVGMQVPEACRFLTLLSFVNYEDIFLELFLPGLPPDSNCSQSWSRVIRDGTVDISLVQDSFAALERYSLLQRQPNGIDYAMHRLVHAWGYDRLEDREEDLTAFRVLASQMLTEAVTAVRSWKKAPQAKLRLVPHLMEHLNTSRVAAKTDNGTNVERIDQIEYYGGFMYEIGRWGEAIRMQSMVIEERQRILGDEHPSTISAMNNLASTLGDQGKLDEAARMKQEVLQKMERILGDEHPSTISAMNNLASTLGDQGKLDEAARMKQEVLQKRQRILGDEHPDTISAMNNLASTLDEQGKLDEAARMFQEVLQKRQRILGDEHPDTISAISNLANTLGDQGKLDKAARMKQEVLQKRQRILGDEHPSTISAMNNLASTLGDQGKLDEAARIFQEALQKMERILGDEHPTTILIRRNLSVISSRLSR
ncbi:hypothetical protein S40288_08003 [Stachybotrys chartarum IBT 40288]|nr:hypothetical protein S40288_08003 [Stachybotrys chartarum IBT 40288]